MGYLERRYTEIVKKYDSKLFVELSPFGTRQVMRENFRPVKYDVDGKTLIAMEKSPFFVTALTRDWTCKTENVEWGELPLLKRLKDIDQWNAESEVNQLEKMQHKAAEASERHFANETEAFVREWRPAFKKAFSDVNVSNLEKIDKRKIKGA